MTALSCIDTVKMPVNTKNICGNVTQNAPK
jgi:hypothetical protein